MHNLTDDVVDDALSDKLRQAMLLAEVVLLHEKTLLLAAALPRRRREEAVDNMVNSLWKAGVCVGCLWVVGDGKLILILSVLLSPEVNEGKGQRTNRR